MIAIIPFGSSRKASKLIPVVVQHANRFEHLTSECKATGRPGRHHATHEPADHSRGTLWNPILTNSALAVGLVMLLARSVLAQESPSPEDSFEVEPPLLVQPEKPAPDQSATEPQKLPVTLEQLRKQLERAKENAASAEHLVKAGVLAKTEAAQRALRAVRLEADVANAELVAGQVLSHLSLSSQRNHSFRIRCSDIGKHL